MDASHDNVAQLQASLLELNESLKKYHEITQGYSKFVFQVSINLHASLCTLLERFHTLTETIYFKDFQPETLEKHLNDIMLELNTLFELNEKLWPISYFKNNRNSFHLLTLQDNVHLRTHSKKNFK